MLSNVNVRIFLFGICCTAIICNICVPCEAQVSWTQYQGNAAHNGYIPATIDPNMVQPHWQVTPQALGGVAFIPGAVTDTNGVYVSMKSKDQYPYEVISLDINSGNKLWDRPFSPYYGTVSQPTTGNGKVYVHTWGHSGISGGNASQYPYVYGLDSQNGNIQFATSHSGQWSSGSRPTVVDDQVFAAGGYYGGLDEYSANSGSKGWFAKVNQQYGWIPAADDQRVYVYMGEASASPGPQTGTLYAFDRATGAQSFVIKNTDDQGRCKGTVTVGGQNDVLAIANGSQGKTLVSFDIGLQSVRWRVPGSFTGMFAVDDNTIFASNGIELSLLNETTGAKMGAWFAPPSESLANNILVTDNLIFLSTDSATYGIDRETLSTVWSADVSGDLALGDGLLLISNDSSLTAYTVPEPAAMSLLVMGGLALIRQRRKA